VGPALVAVLVDRRQEMKRRYTTGYDGIDAMREVLAGNGDEPFWKSADAADNADALSADEPAARHPHVMCPTCKKIGSPDQIRRHFRAKPDHEIRPEPERVLNEDVVSNPEADLTKSGSGIELLEALYRAAQEAKR
jgi:hypothetical protein